jgi:hypothetical protein
MNNNETPQAANVSILATYYQNIASPLLYDVTKQKHRQRALKQFLKKADRGTLDVVTLNKAKTAYLDAVTNQIENILKRVV